MGHRHRRDRPHGAWVKRRGGPGKEASQPCPTTTASANPSERITPDDIQRGAEGVIPLGYGRFHRSRANPSRLPDILPPPAPVGSPARSTRTSGSRGAAAPTDPRRPPRRESRAVGRDLQVFPGSAGRTTSIVFAHRPVVDLSPLPPPENARLVNSNWSLRLLRPLHGFHPLLTDDAEDCSDDPPTAPRRSRSRPRPVSQARPARRRG